ncbi:MAG: aminoglycoside phosphotransferase (APT) family kinase protein [Enterobacterales bacterium]|jgi:aminoglycoside phosphotransferase (APT) family kinase protein
MSLDKATTVREEDSIDIAKVTEFVRQALPEIAVNDSVEILQFPSGASNLTYEIKCADRSLILRTAPKGANIKSAHDMGREYKVLSRLIEHFPYCPRPLAYSADDSVLGCEFYIMEKVEGIIPRRDMPIDYTEQELKLLCTNLIDVQVQLHDVDIVAKNLIELGKPEGYVSRQVSGWCDRYKKARTDDVPQGDELMNWLMSNQPNDSYETAAEASFIHNDYKFDNIVLDINNPTSIISVLDWEMSTVGDPLMDLGCSLAYWVEAGDSEQVQQIRMLPTHLQGMMTRDELVGYYLQKSGRQVDSFNYYYVFGLFRLAVIAQQIYKRYKEGKTHNKKFAQFGLFCTVLINECKKYYK